MLQRNQSLESLESWLINNIQPREIINIGFSLGVLTTSKSWSFNHNQIKRKEIWISPGFWLNSLNSLENFKNTLLNWNAEILENKICLKMFVRTFLIYKMFEMTLRYLLIIYQLNLILYWLFQNMIIMH